MYPTASSVQLEYPPSSSFLPSPTHDPDRYVSDPYLARKTSADKWWSEGQQIPRHQQDTWEQPIQADHWSQPVSGLRTPPTDEMGTTYQMPNMASYESNHMHRSAYAPRAAHADRTRSAMGESMYDTATRYSTSQGYPQQPPQYQQAPPQLQSYQQHPPISHGRQAVLPSIVPQPSTSRPPTRPTTPSSVRSARSLSDASIAARDAGMVLHNLQIPTCISPAGGDLADFTAQITCLFWFESIKTLEAAEKIGSLLPDAPVRRLTENALPLPSFKKWVHTVLSTTQVTQNVIILALMFIYRLKVKNPAVKGRAGSEYRLLTVALMLGNKFLDDNTYTNKTWAEVSGISVTEIHVMEVEFLSNMRYGLLASKEEWEEWLVKLAKFWEYCERAQRPTPSPLVLPSTGYKSSFASPLPSPTNILQLTPGTQQTPQAMQTFSPIHTTPNGNNTPWPTAYQASNATSPLALKPVLQGYRKRNLADEDPTEPPPKRTSRQPVSSQSQSQPQLPGQDTSYPMSDDQSRRFPASSSTAPSESLRLPVPSLSLNTNTQNMTPNLTQAPAGPYATHQPSALSLPPLVPGVRAMSTVFPPSSTAFAPQLPVLGSSGPPMPSLPAPSITPTSSFPPSNYGTPTKRLSPQSALTPVGGAYGSSPLMEAFNHNMTPMGSGSGVRTPISNSPSVYLQQRPSPYKPVRHVNTLLYPPPSAFLHEYHFSNAVPPTQMHYQPLGRRNEFRTGIVPEFAIARNSLFNPGQQQQHNGLPPMSSQPMQYQHTQATQNQNPGQYDPAATQYPTQYR